MGRILGSRRGNILMKFGGNVKKILLSISVEFGRSFS